MERIVRWDEKLVPLKEYRFRLPDSHHPEETGYFVRQIGDYVIFLVYRSRLDSEERMKLLRFGDQKIKGYSNLVEEANREVDYKQALVCFKRYESEIEHGDDKLDRLPRAMLINGDTVAEMYAYFANSSESVKDESNFDAQGRTTVTAAIPSFDYFALDCFTEEELKEYSISLLERAKKLKIRNGPVISEATRFELTYSARKPVISYLSREYIQRLSVNLNRIDISELNLSYIGFNSIESKHIVKLLEVFRPQLLEYLLGSSYKSSKINLSARVDIMTVGDADRVFSPRYGKHDYSPLFTIVHVTKIHSSISESSRLDINYGRNNLDFEFACNKSSVLELIKKATITFPLGENCAFLLKNGEYANFKLTMKGKGEKGVVLTTLWVFGANDGCVNNRDSKYLISACEALKLPFRPTRLIYEMCFGIHSKFAEDLMI